MSESAGQGVEGAWLARLGFLLFGFAVLWPMQLKRRVWGTWGATSLASFGVLMIAVATFSHRHWLSEMPFDKTEDALHSAAATLVGFAFALGVVSISLRREAGAPWHRIVDVVAITASVVIPLGMSQAPEITGLLQRLMFLIAYLWLAIEAYEARVLAHD